MTQINECAMLKTLSRALRALHQGRGDRLKR